MERYRNSNIVWIVLHSVQHVLPLACLVRDEKGISTMRRNHQMRLGSLRPPVAMIPTGSCECAADGVPIPISLFVRLVPQVELALDRWVSAWLQCD